MYVFSCFIHVSTNHKWTSAACAANAQHRAVGSRYTHPNHKSGPCPRTMKTQNRDTNHGSDSAHLRLSTPRPILDSCTVRWREIVNTISIYIQSNYSFSNFFFLPRHCSRVEMSHAWVSWPCLRDKPKCALWFWASLVKDQGFLSWSVGHLVDHMVLSSGWKQNHPKWTRPQNGSERGTQVQKLSCTAGCYNAIYCEMPRKGR